MSGTPTHSEVIARLQAGRRAARSLRASSAEQRNGTLRSLADRLLSDEPRILAANREDLSALSADATPAFRDRLELSRARLAGMAESLRQVALLDDPIGEIAERKVLPNGLIAQRMRSPLGVIFMIFESRPNVAVEAFSLAFKSGNVIALRGGKESRRTTGIFYDLIGESLAGAGLPREVIVGITDPDRELVRSLLQRNDLIDVVVPRGGESLIRAVVEQCRIPIIKNDRGLCHVYVHADADPAMAVAIVRNAKCQRPGVCNAMETLLVHRDRAAEVLSMVRRAIPEVEIHGCPETLRILQGEPATVPAVESDYDVEYLDLKMNVRIVGSLDEATDHIERHGSRHSESILTADRRNFIAFRDAVDAAAVYWNASTRFTDGFELGLGGELGISTQKLHVRGPVGLRELTSLRWVIEGTGQTRG